MSAISAEDSGRNLVCRRRNIKSKIHLSANKKEPFQAPFYFLLFVIDKINNCIVFKDHLFKSTEFFIGIAVTEDDILSLGTNKGVAEYLIILRNILRSARLKDGSGGCKVEVVLIIKKMMKLIIVKMKF